MSDKYVIKNCPCFNEGHPKLAYYGECLSLTDDIEVCQNCTECVLKRIVEKCKKEIIVYRNTLLPNDGTNTLHFGRQSFAYDILKLLDIQEVE